MCQLCYRRAMSAEPMDVKTTDLRRRMPDVLDHIARGGTVRVFRNTRHVADMVPPVREEADDA